MPGNAFQLKKDIGGQLNNCFSGGGGLFTRDEVRLHINTIIDRIDPADYIDPDKFDYGKVEARINALAAARKHVEATKRADYDRNWSAKDRIAEELRIARFLLEEGE